MFVEITDLVEMRIDNVVIRVAERPLELNQELS